MKRKNSRQQSKLILQYYCVHFVIAHQILHTPIEPVSKPYQNNCDILGQAKFIYFDQESWAFMGSTLGASAKTSLFYIR